MSSELDQLPERIWITEKCHMNAERRNRFLEIYFHLLLAFYSVTAIGNGIIGSANKSEVDGSVLLYVSIITLCISLLIFGFKFGETAAQHRTCYLMLQKIRISYKGHYLNEKYIDAISDLPNHKQIDFLRLAIDDPFSLQQKLKQPNGNCYQFSPLELADYVIRRVATWVFLILLVMPAVLVTIWNFRNFTQ
ncbi:SLATT domain-containing protein [Paracoccus sp. KR1-242]|uniref:SLATT domain-containing protein n=1 Tax=Paracoccus sp. KR1-242 TaxID=3410028 RepID=UPI003C0C56FC